ncbi:hypothetical protein Scep_012357 [Stephania cephalantha]|uniref:Uncharacterized protein n=1 Tax=Stephania cephalantha TaxID=152367 RepID=A0AAP0JF03_9MAGN
MDMFHLDWDFNVPVWAYGQPGDPAAARPARRCSGDAEAAGGEQWRRSRRVAVVVDAAGEAAAGSRHGAESAASTTQTADGGQRRERAVAGSDLAAAAAGQQCRRASSDAAGEQCGRTSDAGGARQRLGAADARTAPAAMRRGSGGDATRLQRGTTTDERRRDGAMSTGRMRGFDETATMRWRPKVSKWTPETYESGVGCANRDASDVLKFAISRAIVEICCRSSGSTGKRVMVTVYLRYELLSGRRRYLPIECTLGALIRVRRYLIVARVRVGRHGARPNPSLL